MRRLLSFLLLALLAIPSTALVEEQDDTDSKIFLEKAQEITAGKESRVDKLIAIHAFTRDDIRQVKTKYG